MEPEPTTTLKMARTPSLNIGYEQTGPDFGAAIVLLHGWPYDPRCYDEIRGPLATLGHRVIVPYLRCFGPTVFCSPNAFRSGQQSAIGKDIIDLLDALVRKDPPRIPLVALEVQTLTSGISERL